MKHFSRLLVSPVIEDPRLHLKSVDAYHVALNIEDSGSTRGPPKIPLILEMSKSVKSVIF